MTSIKVNGKDLSDFTGTDFNVFGNNPNIYAHEASLYAEDEMKLGDKWTFNAGLRYSFYHVRGKGYHNVEPRVSARLP